MRSISATMFIWHERRHFQKHRWMTFAADISQSVPRKNTFVSDSCHELCNITPWYSSTNGNCLGTLRADSLIPGNGGSLQPLEVARVIRPWFHVSFNGQSNWLAGSTHHLARVRETGQPCSTSLWTWYGDGNGAVLNGRFLWNIYTFEKLF